MKTQTWILFTAVLGISACNSEAKDSVEKADSTNEVKMDSASSSSASQTIVADEETANFLVKAADGGMAEVECGQLAEQKATNQRVKDYGAMLSRDHGAANDQVKTLASQRNVTLPDAMSDEHKKDKEMLGKKTGADFDKAYIKGMVKDHESDIAMFEKASGNAKDAEVKAFIDNTLPKLRNHLDSAKAIQKGLK